MISKHSIFLFFLFLNVIHTLPNPKSAEKILEQQQKKEAKELEKNSEKSSISDAGTSGSGQPCSINAPSETSCYVEYQSKVYDFTGFLKSHPGGGDVLKGFCGQTGTGLATAFSSRHGGRKEFSDTDAPFICSNPEPAPVPETKATSAASIGACSVKAPTEASCYVEYQSKVYDFTGFLKTHSGGVDVLKGFCGQLGTDLATAFSSKHGAREFSLTKAALICSSPTEGPPSAETTPTAFDVSAVELNTPSFKGICSLFLVMNLYFLL
jgi:cytochrome b involved in lipid metabolism